MNQLGCRWEKAQKGPGSRIAAINLIHSKFTKILPDGKPSLIFFRNCKHLIRTIPTLPKDETNVEDIDPNAEDHPHDALKYGLQYRPRVIEQRKLKGT